MRTQTLTVCMAIGLVAGGHVGAVVQEGQEGGLDRSASSQQVQSGQQPSQQPGRRPGVDMGAPQPGLEQGAALGQVQPMARATKLLGQEVQGQDGKKLGEVEEIMLSQDRRRVEHITVSLDDGDSVKLSLAELFSKRQDEDVLLVLASQEELQRRDIQDRSQVNRHQDEQVSRRVSQLIGMDVQGTDGKDVGSIDDLIIDTQSGQIKSAVFKTGGVAGVGTRLASLEWPQVIFSAEGDAASINMNSDTLSERGIKTDEFWERHTVEGVQAKSTATSSINR